MTLRVRLIIGFSLSLLTWLPVGRTQTLVTMNWGVGAQTITGNSDVSTSGTLVQATNLGDFSDWQSGENSSPVVNGVTFAAVQVTKSSSVQSISVGNFALSAGTGAFLSTDGGTHSANSAVPSPTASLSEAYRGLMANLASTHVPDINRETPGVGDRTMKLTMPNLTIGRTYQFQWWSAMPFVSAATLSAVTGGIQLSSNTSSTQGGLGQFALGTFTASATTMAIEFGSYGSAPWLNAFQLRDLSAVPEPSTYALIAGLAVLALGWAVKRRRT